MSVSVVVPQLGESVSEAVIAKWHKNKGDFVKIDELLLELETEKVTLEVNAPISGILDALLKNQGDSVLVGEIVAQISASNGPSNAAADSALNAASNAAADSASNAASNNTEVKSSEKDSTSAIKNADTVAPDMHKKLAPSVNKMLIENNIDQHSVQGTGKDGRITKGDVIQVVESVSNKTVDAVVDKAADSSFNVERVKMSKLRKTIAQRLKDSQNTAAILTTFNEIDMSNVMNLRQKYKDSFEKKHGVKLGFMSFFVKATVEALKAIPAINAEVDADYIVYKNYYDIGVAVGTEQGLVVPVLRGSDKLSFAAIEKGIYDLSVKARTGKLAMSDLSGGTFSITNGGVYGSLLSTPIINPPQSGILGLHKIQERPYVVDGKIEVRSLMYVALSYDHRIVDGKEAVTFLVKIKEAIENPERLLLEV